MWCLLFYIMLHIILFRAKSPFTITTLSNVVKLLKIICIKMTIRYEKSYDSKLYIKLMSLIGSYKIFLWMHSRFKAIVIFCYVRFKELLNLKNVHYQIKWFYYYYEQFKGFALAVACGDKLNNCLKRVSKTRVRWAEP